MKSIPLIFAMAFCSLSIVVHKAEGAVCAKGPTLQGVDVSVYQGTVDWSQVSAAGKAFAFARVSDGSYLDTTFADNWTAIKAAGMARSVYQYFEPGQDPTMQANIVINAVGVLGPGDLPAVLDVEVTGGQSPSTIALNIHTWMTQIEAGTGRVPMIYTAVNFWNSSVGTEAFSTSPLWAANWDVTCPTLAYGWTNWAFWQYSDNGTVAGISDAVDLDEFDGSMSDLLAMADEPSLNVAANPSDKIAIRWSTFANGFVLQQNSDLGTTNWTSVTTGGTVVSNQNQLIVSTSTNQTFFRLHRGP